MKLKKCVGIFLFSTLCLNVGAIDHKGITFDRLAPDRFTLMENGVANEILVDEQEDAGVMIAVRNLQNDFKRVSGRTAGFMLYSRCKAHDYGRYVEKPLYPGIGKGEKDRCFIAGGQE